MIIECNGTEDMKMHEIKYAKLCRNFYFNIFSNNKYTSAEYWIKHHKHLLCYNYFNTSIASVVEYIRNYPIILMILNKFRLD